MRAAILETVEGLATDPPSAKEMEKSRNQIEADFAFGQEHNFDLGQGLGAQECRSSWQDFDRFQEACLTVDSVHVARVAAAYLKEKTRTTGYLVPEGGTE
jgi:predicted Zn-dependent peptidase